MWLFDDDLSTPTLVDELTGKVEHVRFGSALHGGFKDLAFDLPARLSDAWTWFYEEGRKGYHFYRIVIQENTRLIWEGRVMDPSLRITPAGIVVHVVALGYWSACRDQMYRANTGGMTNWTAGGPHTADDVIKEMLTNDCPDISSDQSNISANTRDIVGINLENRKYPMDVIVDDLAPLADSDGTIWYFAIWDSRKAYWSARSLSSITWRTRLSECVDVELSQSASQLRNAVYPFAGTTEGTIQTDAGSLTLYPRREMGLLLPTSTNANTQSDAATAAASERGTPYQTQRFAISGKIWDSNGAEAPKWRVRAGDVIRIEDLVPSSQSSPTFDALRTFFILGADYDADRDVVSIQPDTAGRSLRGLLPRLGSVEKRR